MRLSFVLAGAIVLFTRMPGLAHRLDEYLQATMLSVETDRIAAQIRLTPGIAVLPAVLAGIDADADGTISDAERSKYAKRVIRDLSLTVDGNPLRLRLDSVKFAKIEEMQAGLGEIQLDVHADLHPGGPNRKLVFRNRHQSGMAAYLVNSLVSPDPRIRLAGQNRNPDQSVYELDYVQAEGSSGPLSAWWSGERMWTGIAALLILGRFGWLWRAGSLRVRPDARSAI